jgi:hypothetical protein
MPAETMRHLSVWLALALCLFVIACGHDSKPQQKSQPESKSVGEPLVPDVGDGWLSFSLLGPEAEPNSDATRFHATYRAEGKVARFDFELNIKQPSADGLQFGRFIAVPGSESSVLLLNLKKTLEAKKSPVSTQRAAEIPFAFILLGNDMSHSVDGGMSSDPRGHWTTLKLFIGHEKDESEVFLNYNASLHKGEFSIKDAEYGDTLLRYLAKVL